MKKFFLPLILTTLLSSSNITPELQHYITKYDMSLQEIDLLLKTSTPQEIVNQIKQLEYFEKLNMEYICIKIHLLAIQKNHSLLSLEKALKLPGLENRLKKLKLTVVDLKKVTNFFKEHRQQALTVAKINKDTLTLMLLQNSLTEHERTYYQACYKLNNAYLKRLPILLKELAKHTPENP